MLMQNFGVTNKEHYGMLWYFLEWSIERFHSRGQRLCKFMGTNESVYIRKQSNSQRIVLVHQHGRHFIVLEHQYGRRDVMWKRSIERINLLLPLREKLGRVDFRKDLWTVISVRKTNWPLAHWRVPSNHPRNNCGTQSVPVILSFMNCLMSTVSLFLSPFQYVRERSPGNKFAIPSLSVSSPFPAGKAARVTTLPANISGAQRLR